MFATRSNMKCYVQNDGADEYIEVESIPDEIFYNAEFYSYVDGEFIFNEERKRVVNRLIEIHTRIDELKNNLDSTDYVIIKIAEGCSTVDEYADIVASRGEWRTEINELEAELEELGE